MLTLSILLHMHAHDQSVLYTSVMPLATFHCIIISTQLLTFLYMYSLTYTQTIIVAIVSI